ncbi:SGNH/GDSL hydrolase family protein [Eubacteriaceae bacterium ES2]|nr:SGNH/GDSL hydrolase family protein [Eubacteriaceae bacterium ES2]
MGEIGFVHKIKVFFIKGVQISSFIWNKKIKIPTENLSSTYFQLNGDSTFSGFLRLPKGTANMFSKGLNVNSRYSAGLKLCFKTNATRVTFRVLFRKRAILNHMSLKAISGIDVYVKYDKELIWLECFSSESSYSMIAKSVINLFEGEKVIEIFLPPFAQVESFEVGIDNNFSFEQIYSSNEKVVLIYGSSITQGCAASRPSLSYTNLISRKTEMKVINMGFSESAKGEERIINYLSEIQPTVFVMEYDHNATLKELDKTHKKAYTIFRNSNPNCLIIMLTRLSGGLSIDSDEEEERIKIIRKTYECAINNNDNNIEIIYGNKLINCNKEDFFVDDRHPNDRGMFEIANAICLVLKKRGLYK